MGYESKILIVGESPLLPTAAAETLRLVFAGLLEGYPGKHELHQVGLAHVLAVTEPKWPIYPTKSGASGGQTILLREDLYGEQTVHEIIGKVEPDIVFAFNRPECLLHLCRDKAERSYGLILYLKLDDFPVPKSFGPVLKRADRIFTMSEFSREELLRCLPELEAAKVGVMYPPADTARFTPLAEDEKAELREALLPEWMPRDAFVLGWVGRNRWRKQVWVLYKIMHYLRTGKYLVCERCGRVSLFDLGMRWEERFTEGNEGNKDRLKDGNTTGETRSIPTISEARPGYAFDVCAHCSSKQVKPAEPLKDVFLWMHMVEDDPASAWPAQYLEWEFGVKRNEDVFYTEGYSMKAALPPEDMPTLYQLWDGLLYLSGSEGFGLSAWEAMGCGLPVVYTDYSAHAEFLRAANAGLPVDGVLQPEKKTGFMRMVADVMEAIEAVRKLYYDRELGRKLGRNGRAFVEEYRVEKQAERWHRVFEGLVKREADENAL